MCSYSLNSRLLVAVLCSHNLSSVDCNVYVEVHGMVIPQDWGRVIAWRLSWQSVVQLGFTLIEAQTASLQAVLGLVTEPVLTEYQKEKSVY